MNLKIYIRQTPMGAYHWQLFNTQSHTLLAQSCEYVTPEAARKGCDEIFTVWPQVHASIEDQTPEAKRGL